MAFKGVSKETGLPSVSLVASLILLASPCVPQSWGASTSSFAWLASSPAGLLFTMDVTGGIPGLLQTEHKGELTSLTFAEDFGAGTVQAHNAQGVHAHTKVRRYCCVQGCYSGVLSIRRYTVI